MKRFYENDIEKEIEETVLNRLSSQSIFIFGAKSFKDCNFDLRKKIIRKILREYKYYLVIKKSYSINIKIDNYDGVAIHFEDEIRNYKFSYIKYILSLREEKINLRKEYIKFNKIQWS